MGPQLIPLGNGLYNVQINGEIRENLTEAQATEVLSQGGQNAEQIQSLFTAAKAGNAPAPQANPRDKSTSIFANTGIENGGDKVKTRGEYHELKRRYREELYMEVHDKGGIEGYKHRHAGIHARKYVRAQKAADRVMSSVYFTPDQKEEYEKQKKDLEASGKRPVLLSEKDMELLHSPEFILTDMDGNAIDLDGNLIGADLFADKNAMQAELDEKQGELEQAKEFAKLIQKADAMSEDNFNALQDIVNAMSEEDKQKPENAEYIAIVNARGQKEENDEKIKLLEAETKQLQEDIENKEQEYNEYVKNNAITAFKKDANGKEVLDEDMVKLISAVRIGTDNRLEMEERKAETEALTNKGEKQPTSRAGKWLKKKWDESPIGKHWHMRKAKRLYEHLGYSIQSDNTEIYQAAIIAASVGAGAGAAAAWGSETVTVAGKVVTRVLGTFKFVTPELVPGVEHNETVLVDGQEHHLHWTDADHVEDVEHEVTLTSKYRTPDKTYTNVDTSIAEGALDGLAVGLVLAGLVDDTNKKNDIILHDMSPEAFVSAAWDDTDGTAYKKNIDLPRNRAMMEYVVNKAKATGMTQEDLVAEIKRAQGTNDCLTEDEMLKLVTDMRKRERAKINTIEVPQSIEPKDDVGSMARVEVKPENYDETVTSQNTPYKLQNEETLANVIRAKYGITDPNDLKEAIREVRRATGIPESGYNANGTLAIPHIEVDGKPVKDAYFLPPSLLNGKYPLDMSKEVTTFHYSKRGEAAQGNSQATTTTETKQRWVWTVTDPISGKVLYEGTDYTAAGKARNEYNEKHLNGPRAELKKAGN